MLIRSLISASQEYSECCSECGWDDVFWWNVIFLRNESCLINASHSEQLGQDWHDWVSLDRVIRQEWKLHVIILSQQVCHSFRIYWHWTQGYEATRVLRNKKRSLISWHSRSGPGRFSNMIWILENPTEVFAGMITIIMNQRHVRRPTLGNCYEAGLYNESEFPTFSASSLSTVPSQFTSCNLKIYFSNERGETAVLYPWNTYLNIKSKASSSRFFSAEFPPRINKPIANSLKSIRPSFKEIYCS